jgi:hypothetical protein
MSDILANLDDSKYSLLQGSLSDPQSFTSIGQLTLRSYQVNVFRAIVRSVISQLGLSFVVMFPRQSGKNELQAQIEAFLLMHCSQRGAEMIKISPTWKPQSQNAMNRLERVLNRHPLLSSLWAREQGYRFRAGAALQTFLSGSPEANIVGATASTLLQVDEAQDIRIDKYDKEIAPMAASTNATRVFWGTAWTSDTLLARELQLAREAQDRDAVRRAFVLTADAVAAEVPAYGAFVRQQIERLGRSHPMVRTQFFSEMLESGGGLFTAARLALIAGTHSSELRPRPGLPYALLLDVAGEDAAAGQNTLENPQRDYTALTVVAVDSSQPAPWGGHWTVYRVVARKAWHGIAHTQLYTELLAQARHWGVQRLVVDASGVGAGICSFLERALPGRVTPFVFTSASKSRLGWDFLTLIDSGRYREHSDATPEQDIFYEEARACRYSTGSGVERHLHWSVPPGLRRSADGSLLHDDWLISAALCAVLEGHSWGGSITRIIRAPDPLREMDGRWSRISD